MRSHSHCGFDADKRTWCFCEVFSVFLCLKVIFSILQFSPTLGFQDGLKYPAFWCLFHSLCWHYFLSDRPILMFFFFCPERRQNLIRNLVLSIPLSKSLRNDLIEDKDEKGIIYWPSMLFVNWRDLSFCHLLCRPVLVSQRRGAYFPSFTAGSLCNTIMTEKLPRSGRLFPCKDHCDTVVSRWKNARWNCAFSNLLTTLWIEEP